MRKYISIAMAILMVLCCLTACGNSTETADSADSDKLQIVTTIFPEYDWVREILGDEADNAEVTMLLDNGVDLHSYQTTADDILKISNCDLFIYVGGESDEWVDDALKEAVNKDMQVINMLDVLGDMVKEEEVVEGMEAEDEEGEEDGDEEIEYDEHVWLSLKNAEVLCDAIADALSNVDSEHKNTYTSNAQKYNEKLAALNQRYREMVDGSKKDTVLFGDRFPFRYMVDDYGLNYYAAFVGCSAESEASFETITFLSGKVDELKLTTVLTIEKSNQEIAKTIVENTKEKNQKILEMDSMQSVTSDDIEKGASYLSIMQSNLGVLQEALN